MKTIKENAARYRRSEKKLKSEILEELSVIVGYNRTYLAFIRSNQDFIFTSSGLNSISSHMKEMFLTISPATIERRLAPVRKKEELKGRYKTNPHASNIKKRIPVQTHFDKPKDRFGLAEIDLVFHCGESTQGEFAYTLTVTEITSGWTELRVIQNRAQVWSVAALKEVVDSLPFKVIAIHSDNGSEFINAFLPHKPTSCSCGDPVATLCSTNKGSINNLFIPTMKLCFKQRDGGKVRKQYTIHTPFERLVDSRKLSKAQMTRLTKLRQRCDYFRIVKAISNLAKKLDRAYENKYHSKEVA